MEKDITRTGREGSSRGLILSSSAPPPQLLNYHTESQHLGAHEAELMTMSSSSSQKELLMDMVCHQDLVDKHNAALFLLKEMVMEVQDLQKENFNLEIVNADLSNRLAVFQKAVSDHTASFGYSAMRMDPKLNVNEALTGLESLEMMSLGSGVNQGPSLDDVATQRGCPNPTPTLTLTPISPMDSGQVEGNGEGLEDRVSLPKSIAVRSSGYLKMVKPEGSSKGKENKVLKRSKSSGKMQKVYVQGKEKEETPIELEVYNQGMSKTELCNKWQETGTCSYEKNCHFAHGVEELRPVIRHPRYKTEVCRMMLNGDSCNYGHRCHFRHALSDEEKLIRSNNLRTLKSLNR